MSLPETFQDVRYIVEQVLVDLLRQEVIFNYSISSMNLNYDNANIEFIFEIRFDPTLSYYEMCFTVRDRTSIEYIQESLRNLIQNHATRHALRPYQNHPSFQVNFFNITPEKPEICKDMDEVFNGLDNLFTECDNIKNEIRGSVYNGLLE